MPVSALAPLSSGTEPGMAVAAQIDSIRRDYTKHVLDALMSLNWALDHPSVRFSNFVVGGLGVASAWLGLRQKWAAHVAAIESEWTDDNEYDEQVDGEGGAVAADGDARHDGCVSARLARPDVLPDPEVVREGVTA